VRSKRDGKLTRTFLHRFKWKGDETRIATGIAFPKLAESRAEVRRQREEANKGIDPRRARPRRRDRVSPLSLSSDAVGSKHSIEFLASEFIERHVRPRRKRPEYAEWMVARKVLPEWKGRDARSITPREVVELLDGIADKAPVMANHVSGLLGQLFRFGIHRSIIATSPVQLLYRPGGKEKPRERVLSDEELKAYLADPLKCTRFPRLAHVVTLLLLTAQRRGELAAARWSEIDLNARTWVIPDANSKTGRGHTVPLTDWAVEEFRALKAFAKHSPWVLPGKDASQHVEPRLLTRGVAKCLKRFKEAGIEAFTLHDLRRTARTGFGRLKIRPDIGERVLNHVQPGVTDVYDRGSYLDEKRLALETWASHLSTLRGS
jgi:integrase